MTCVKSPKWRELNLQSMRLCIFFSLGLCLKLMYFIMIWYSMFADLVDDARVARKCPDYWKQRHWGSYTFTSDHCAWNPVFVSTEEYMEFTFPRAQQQPSRSYHRHNSIFCKCTVASSRRLILPLKTEMICVYLSVGIQRPNIIFTQIFFLFQTKKTVLQK